MSGPAVPSPADFSGKRRTAGAPAGLIPVSQPSSILIRRGPDTLTMSAASLLHEEAVRHYARGDVEKAETLFSRLAEMIDQAFRR